MSEVSDLIEKTINPPGIQKRNRGSVFGTIRDVAAKVRADALTAFNAHFPYLADEKKLEEHGKALLIPHLTDDTEKEYRGRVSTASFFLMRAGERAYILEQLNAHFGDRYILSDEFLNVYVKILDLSESDHRWTFDLLDSLLNPNILLTVAEWFRYIEHVLISETHPVTVRRDTYENYPNGLRCDGRFYCDQGVQNLCDGGFACDGTADCTGWRYRRGTVSDIVKQEVFCNGKIICNGDFDCSGFRSIYDPLDVPDPVLPQGSGDFLQLTEMFRQADSGAFEDAPMRLRITASPHCDGRPAGCSLCDGSIICDGSYSGFDGWYCGEDIQEECV
jgi:hypothetical protein